MPESERNVFVPLVTPSKHDEFFPLIDHIIKGGIQNLVLFGTTGEGEKIDIATKKSVIRKIASFVGERARLYIGLLCSNLSEALHLTEFCYELGFEGALLPPHLYGTEPVAIVSQFLDNSSSKFILYNPPGANPLEKIIHMFDPLRVVGLKDSSGDIALVKKLTTMSQSRSHKIYYGREHLLDKALELDIDGIFPGTGNINPQLLLQLWKQRDEESLIAFNQLKQKVRTNCPDNYIQGLKICLQELGIINP